MDLSIIGRTKLPDLLIRIADSPPGCAWGSYTRHGQDKTLARRMDELISEGLVVRGPLIMDKGGFGLVPIYITDKGRKLADILREIEELRVWIQGPGGALKRFSSLVSELGVGDEGLLGHRRGARLVYARRFEFFYETQVGGHARFLSQLASILLTV